MGSGAAKSVLEGLEKKKEIEEQWRSIYTAQQPLALHHFPHHFIFGAATSAHQVEGASNEDGRGPSIWDAFARVPGKISDGSNADVAVDQYHRYKEDIEIIAKLGFKAYRFSISWSRIFPDGLGTRINLDGIRHYNNVINALLDKDIQPYVTLYHWDLPLHLFESMGGWLNKDIVKHFAIYAETCFSSFGDRVKNWITINEPLQTAIKGYYNGTYAPGRCDHPSTEPYLVAHHQLLAHAEAVSIYNKQFKEKQHGQIGIIVDSEWSETLSDRVEDINAAQRSLDFQLGWFLDPIFYGDYPETMRKILGDSLPKFSQDDRQLLDNSVDFIGLNHYTTRFILHAANTTVDKNDFYSVQGIEKIAEWEGGERIGEKAASPWLYAVPWGLWKVLNYISKRYKNTPTYVTENGMDDEDDGTNPINKMLDDELRVSYFKGYIAAVHQAIKDGADVRGYFAWSLLDNFEWQYGYSKRFSLIYVDYKNGLARHLKSSARWFMGFLTAGDNQGCKSEKVSTDLLMNKT